MSVNEVLFSTKYTITSQGLRLNIEAAMLSKRYTYSLGHLIKLFSKITS